MVDWVCHLRLSPSQLAVQMNSYEGMHVTFLFVKSVVIVVSKHS